MKTASSKNAPQLSQAMKDGQAAGVWLGEVTARMLLTEFSNRKTDRGEASQRVSACFEQHRAALGVMADDPKIADTLHALDGAIWDCAVEHEDRAWFAAWTLAMRLCGK